MEVSKKRKPYNPLNRWMRERRALLNTHRVAVVSIDPEGRQGLINWKTCRSISPGRTIAEAVCDMAHPWVIYIGAFCIDQGGKKYIKAIEVAPQGIYRSDDLAEVIKEHYLALLDTCNRAHVVGSGWIANPSSVSLTEEQADRIFEAAGAWNQQREAA